MSHKKIWEMTIKKRYNRVLVLEDDIHILPNFKDLEKCLTYVPDDWDIVYLGSSQYEIEKKINPYISKLKHVFCTLGYIINYKSASKLLKVFPIEKPIDTCMNWGRNTRFDPQSLNKYMLEPNLIQNGLMTSDIQFTS